MMLVGLFFGENNMKLVFWAFNDNLLAQNQSDRAHMLFSIFLCVVDSVLCDPITYARCEHFPGSESPLSLTVYAWPYDSACLLDPTVLQTVLISGTSSLPAAGTSTAAPFLDLGAGQLLESGLPGCLYRLSGSGGLPFSDGNLAYGLQLHHPRFLEFVGSPESARLLDCSPTFWVDQLGKDKALAAAITLQRDAGVML